MRDQEILGNALIILSFDGSNYHGWQIQKNAISIQEVFQNALKKVVKYETNIKGCSRTDAGVHANMYCLNVKIPIKIETKKLVIAINNYLPNDIVVVNCFKVNENFHARYSCLAKEYIYKLYFDNIKDPFLSKKVFYYPYKLDLELIKLTSSFLVGSHDFSSFCSNNNNYKKNNFNFTKKIFYIDINKNEKIINFKIKANGFLYNMARIIVGTLMEISKKKLPAYYIKTIIEKKDRKFAGLTLPANGLYLNKVFYKGFDHL